MEEIHDYTCGICGENLRGSVSKRLLLTRALTTNGGANETAKQ